MYEYVTVTQSLLSCRYLVCVFMLSSIAPEVWGNYEAIHGGGGGDDGGGGGGGGNVCLRTFTKTTILSEESVVLNTHVQQNDERFE